MLLSEPMHGASLPPGACRDANQGKPPLLNTLFREPTEVSQKKKSLSCSHFRQDSPVHPPRGQVSLETLLVLIVFLTALGISYSIITRLGSAAQGSVAASLSKSSFAEFSSKLSEACTLGNGNVRIVEVKGEPALVAAQGGAYSFSAGGFSAAANSTCAITVLQSRPSSHFTISNTGGEIEIS